MKRNKTFWLIAAAVFVLDRITKELAPGIPPEGIMLIPGVAALRYAENTGMAFSLLSGQPRLLGAAGILLLAAAFLLLRKKEMAPLPAAGLAMMAGGAAGNITDRLVRGYVPDMIEALFVRFPVFNAADSFLTVGCVLVAVCLLFRPGDFAEKGKEA